MMLHSPAFTEGWGAMFGRIRGQFVASAKLRELAMSVVARLNEAAPEWDVHAPLWQKAGATDAQLAAVNGLSLQNAKADFAPFDETERAVLQLTIEMTRSVKVAP